jgi:hypothetical protein
MIKVIIIIIYKINKWCSHILKAVVYGWYNFCHIQFVYFSK